MNLRQNKRRLVAKLHYIVLNGAYQKQVNAAVNEIYNLPEVVSLRAEFWKELEGKMSLRSLVEDTPEVAAAKIEYVVAKKSTGEVVGTFDLEEDAIAMIEKARKAKKATLILV